MERVLLSAIEHSYVFPLAYAIVLIQDKI